MILLIDNKNWSREKKYYGHPKLTRSTEQLNVGFWRQYYHYALEQQFWRHYYHYALEQQFWRHYYHYALERKAVA